MPHCPTAPMPQCPNAPTPQVLTIKPSNSINSIRNCFSVEAVIMARTFPAYPYPNPNQARTFPAYGPICCRTNNSMGVGFGLMGLEHPAFKGDAEVS